MLLNLKFFALDDELYLDECSSRISKYPNLLLEFESQLKNLTPFKGFQNSNSWNQIEFLQISKAPHPFSEYCGDYHYYYASNDLLHLGLFDFIGHGIRAAATASRVHLYSKSWNKFKNPKDLLFAFHHQLENLINSKTVHEQDTYLISNNVTANATVIMFDKYHQATYAEASDCPILKFNHQSNDIEFIKKSSIIASIGLIDPQLENRTIPFEHGDILALYTDGFAAHLVKAMIHRFSQKNDIFTLTELSQIWDIFFKTATPDELAQFDIFQGNFNDPYSIRSFLIGFFKTKQWNHDIFELILGKAILGFLIQKHHNERLAVIKNLISYRFEGILRDDDIALTLIRRN